MSQSSDDAENNQSIFHDMPRRKPSTRKSRHVKPKLSRRKKKGGFSIRNSRLGRYSRHQLKRLPYLTEDFCRSEVQRSNKGKDKIKGIVNRRKHSLLKRGCYEKFPHVKDVGFRSPYIVSKDVYETYRPVDDTGFSKLRKLFSSGEPGEPNGNSANNDYRYPDADAVLSKVRSKTSSQGTINFMEFALNNFKRPLDDNLKRELRAEWSKVSYFHKSALRRYKEVPSDVKNSAIFQFVQTKL